MSSKSFSQHYHNDLINKSAIITFPITRTYNTYVQIQVKPTESVNITYVSLKYFALFSVLIILH
ncbi:hypothetical protein T4B_14744 [Trichinella pseudospiralis]|uniref:Uncharacterized protein n=1 Tax=Trichinella pseudospiralis TaxID=6337 RepID=A0A0V1JCJ4_TRIPS|nr:hypothetical protein T4B_14744 [Trichinella pseudospiralis]